MKYIHLKNTIKKLPKNMIKEHKLMYLDNVLEIKKNKLAGINTGYNETMKSTNFHLIAMHVETRNTAKI